MAALERCSCSWSILFFSWRNGRKPDSTVVIRAFARAIALSTFALTVAPPERAVARLKLFQGRRIQRLVLELCSGVRCAVGASARLLRAVLRMGCHRQCLGIGPRGFPARGRGFPCWFSWFLKVPIPIHLCKRCDGLLFSCACAAARHSGSGHSSQQSVRT